MESLPLGRARDAPGEIAGLTGGFCRVRSIRQNPPVKPAMGFQRGVGPLAEVWRQRPKALSLTFGAHLSKALAAVDRAILPGTEGHLGFLAASGADSGEHFLVLPQVVLTGSAALFASLGLVFKALFGVELLLDRKSVV